MRKSHVYLLALLSSLWMTSSIALADDEIIIEEPSRGIPVQTAILTRRYGAVETEDEVAAQELEAGYGATNTFKFVHWNRFYRPYGWYGYYGPRYYAAYRPRYNGYYPSYGPYWAGYYGPPMPYAAYYAPPMYYGGWGGCYYW
jgi:hypothetical protein